jgi:putative transposase
VVALPVPPVTNLLDHLPPSVSQPEASAELKAIFNASNRAEADRLLELMAKKYRPSAPKLAAWLESDVPVFLAPLKQRRKLRTNNCLERLNRELKRRTRVVGVFPNEASLLRLATALLMETDEEWQTEKRYLPKPVK